MRTNGAATDLASPSSETAKLLQGTGSEVVQGEDPESSSERRICPDTDLVLLSSALETMRKALCELPDASRAEFRALVRSWRQGETGLQDLSDGLSAALRASSENEACEKALVQLTHAGRIADAQMRLRRLGVVASAAAVSAVKAHLADYVHHSSVILSCDSLSPVKNELPTHDDSEMRELEPNTNMGAPQPVPCKQAVQNLKAAAADAAAPLIAASAQKEVVDGGDHDEQKQRLASSLAVKDEPMAVQPKLVQSGEMERVQSATSTVAFSYELAKNVKDDAVTSKEKNNSLALKAPVADAASRESTREQESVIISGDC